MNPLLLVLANWHIHTEKARRLLGSCVQQIKDASTETKTDMIEVTLFSGEQLGFVPRGSTVADAKRVAKEKGYVAHADDAQCLFPGDGKILADDTILREEKSLLVCKIFGGFNAEVSYARARVLFGNSTLVPGPGPEEVTLVARTNNHRFIGSVINARTGKRAARWCFPQGSSLGKLIVSTNATTDMILVHNYTEVTCFRLLRDKKLVQRRTHVSSSLLSHERCCLTHDGRYLVLVNRSTLVFHDLSSRKQHEEFEVPSRHGVRICGPAVAGKGSSAVFCETRAGPNAFRRTTQEETVYKVSIGRRRKMAVITRLPPNQHCSQISPEGDVILFCDSRTARCTLTNLKTSTSYKCKVNWKYDLARNWQYTVDQQGASVRTIRVKAASGSNWCTVGKHTVSISAQDGKQRRFFETSLTGDGLTFVTAIGIESKRANSNRANDIVFHSEAISHELLRSRIPALCQ